MEFWDTIVWNCWSRWVYNWKHRNDTKDEAAAELYLHWEDFLEAVKDEPATRELHNAISAMEVVKKEFGNESSPGCRHEEGP
jgi:hypothetical protein